MKILIAFLMTLIGVSNGVAQVKSGEVDYRAVIYDSTIEQIVNKAEKKGAASAQGVRFAFNKLRRGLPYLRLNLKFSQNEAYYTSLDAMNNDGGVNLNLARTFTSSNGVCYANISDNIVLNQIHAFGELYLVKSKLNRLNWKIHEETAKICGYICRKATVKESNTAGVATTTTAWFCPSLPFQFGPAGYNGLPGLILKLNMRGTTTIYAKKIKLKKSDMKIKKPAEGQVIKLSDFRAKRPKFIPEKP